MSVFAVRCGLCLICESFKLIHRITHTPHSRLLFFFFSFSSAFFFVIRCWNLFIATQIELRDHYLACWTCELWLRSNSCLYMYGERNKIGLGASMFKSFVWFSSHFVCLPIHIQIRILFQLFRRLRPFIFYTFWSGVTNKVILVCDIF